MLYLEHELILFYYFTLNLPNFKFKRIHFKAYFHSCIGPGIKTHQDIIFVSHLKHLSILKFNKQLYNHNVLRYNMIMYYFQRLKFKFSSFIFWTLLTTV